MHQFFVESSQVGEEYIEILGGDAHHIAHVLRMKAGGQLRVSDSQGRDFFCEAEQVAGECVKARILYQDHESAELPVKIFLFQGLPKGDKMELIIQKAVELGVYEIIPVAMRNCVARLAGDKAAQRVSRWNRIAEGAAKQSRRGRIPKVREVMDFAEAASYARAMDRRLIPYENVRGMGYTREVIGSLPREGSLAVFIGPEGGFDKGEIASVREDACLISLGNRILRTETAGMAMLSILLYHLEE